MYPPGLFRWIFLLYHGESVVNFHNCVKDSKELPDTTYVTSREFALKYCLFQSNTPENRHMHRL